MVFIFLKTYKIVLSCSLNLLDVSANTLGGLSETMHTNKAVVIFGLILFLFSTTFACASAASTSFSLSAETAYYRYLLPAGTTFNGSITTSGTIRFWASDPNGTQIVNLGLVDKSATFSFVAQQDGNYTLNFENDLINTVQVTFTYTTNPDISSNNQPANSLNTILILIVLTVIGSIAIVVFMRLRERKHFVTPKANQEINLNCSRLL